ncbi:hypothetical protein GMES_1069 [Paraglaciecola mesophila KMM 241]|uniref:Uncharacterized protein n=1 Tax=Paraglaciecola mesophila KMM 241 TaxID=1128912 RepID=K6Z308_9ALTE|nr:hypothetical protein GMES_1069 [Paraglaciecola mesophila KMM 241]
MGIVLRHQGVFCYLFIPLSDRGFCLNRKEVMLKYRKF